MAISQWVFNLGTWNLIHICKICGLRCQEVSTWLNTKHKNYRHKNEPRVKKVDQTSVWHQTNSEKSFSSFDASVYGVLRYVFIGILCGTWLFCTMLVAIFLASCPQGPQQTKLTNVTRRGTFAWSCIEATGFLRSIFLLRLWSNFCGFYCAVLA